MLTPKLEKCTERVALLVTPSQMEFLRANIEPGGINAFLRWLLDSHISQVEKQNGENKK